MANAPHLYLTFQPITQQFHCSLLMSLLCFIRFLLLAPPSAPQIYLQIPPHQQTNQRALPCLLGGFYPQ